MGWVWLPIGGAEWAIVGWCVVGCGALGCGAVGSVVCDRERDEMERVGVLGWFGMRCHGCDFSGGVCVRSDRARVGWVGLDGNEMKRAGEGWGGVVSWGRSGWARIGRIWIMQYLDISKDIPSLPP